MAGRQEVLPYSGLESVLDSYVLEAPSAQNMLDVFRGEWTSRFPPPHQDLMAGSIPLFEDHRIGWMFEELGGVLGFRVLELGPLEGAHSYMLDRAGAMDVLAIEANQRAFLKCLLAKEVLGMPVVRFALGDFRAFLEGAGEQTWDLCVASGVLYHMRDPIGLLRRMATRSDRLYLWTHYYDGERIGANANLKHRFSGSSEARTGTFPYTVHRFQYLEAVDSMGFCGGSAPYAHWLSRDTIFEALRHFGGYDRFSIGHEEPEHPHGPCFSVLARR